MEKLNLALAISSRNIRSKDPMIICGVYSFNENDILNYTSISENTSEESYSNLRNRFYRFIKIETKDIPKKIIKDNKGLYLPGLEMIAFSQLIEPFKKDLKNIQIHVKDENHNYIKNIEDILDFKLKGNTELITNKNKYSHLMMFARNLAHNLYLDSIKYNQLKTDYLIKPKLYGYEELILPKNKDTNKHLR